MATHHLRPSRETLHGTFSHDFPPVLTIEPDDTVVFETLDAGWTIEAPKDQLTEGTVFSPKDPEKDRGHALVGPVFVSGAKPGMVLVVEIGAIVPGSYGWNFGSVNVNGVNDRLGLTGDRIRLGWNLDSEKGIATDQYGHSVKMRPFFGVMGIAPAEDGYLLTSPPRVTGGNIDCKELVAGTTLFLPIAVEGALFSCGDGHARQGDGEVSTTAIECPIASGTLTFSLRDDLSLTTPMAWTPEGWLTFGFHEDLDEAALIALNAMLDLLERDHGIERKVGLALASVVVDLRVTQIVNGVRGVHAVLPHGAIEGL
ncbi:MAG TPA: acetamidase/formamidase family protein [Thermomicrobiales bacterium]|nr:acetamidase/formamidase family protein [Thermomicrobiales bacterium]